MCPGLAAWLLAAGLCEKGAQGIGDALLLLLPPGESRAGPLLLLLLDVAVRMSTMLRLGKHQRLWRRS